MSKRRVERASAGGSSADSELADYEKFIQKLITLLDKPNEFTAFFKLQIDYYPKILFYLFKCKNIKKETRLLVFKTILETLKATLGARQFQKFIDKRNGRDQTVLLAVSREEEPEYASLLVEYGASVEFVDEQGKHALCFACVSYIQEKDPIKRALTLNLIKQLFAKKNDPNIASFQLKKGTTIFQGLLGQEDSEKVSALLKVFIENQVVMNLNECNDGDVSPFMLAGCLGVEILQGLLSRASAPPDVFIVDKNGKGIIFYFCQWDAPEENLKWLLSYIASVLQKLNDADRIEKVKQFQKDKNLALMACIENKELKNAVKNAQTLLKQGADPLMISSEANESALTQSVSHESFPIFYRILIQIDENIKALEAGSDTRKQMELHAQEQKDISLWISVYKQLDIFVDVLLKPSNSADPRSVPRANPNAELRSVQGFSSLPKGIVYSGALIFALHQFYYLKISRTNKGLSILRCLFKCPTIKKEQFWSQNNHFINNVLHFVLAFNLWDVANDEFWGEVGEIDAVDIDGHTALSLAVKELTIPTRITRLLLSRGASPLKMSKAGVTPLHYIIKRGEVGLLDETITQFRLEVNRDLAIQRSEINAPRSMLMSAAETAIGTEVLEYLVKKGADIEGVYDNRTALICSNKIGLPYLLGMLLVKKYGLREELLSSETWKRFIVWFQARGMVVNDKQELCVPVESFPELNKHFKKYNYLRFYIKDFPEILSKLQAAFASPDVSESIISDILLSSNKDYQWCVQYQRYEKELALLKSALETRKALTNECNHLEVDICTLLDRIQGKQSDIQEAQASLEFYKREGQSKSVDTGKDFTTDKAWCADKNSSTSTGTSTELDQLFYTLSKFMGPEEKITSEEESIIYSIVEEGPLVVPPSSLRHKSEVYNFTMFDSSLNKQTAIQTATSSEETQMTFDDLIAANAKSLAEGQGELSELTNNKLSCQKLQNKLVLVLQRMEKNLGALLEEQRRYEAHAVSKSRKVEARGSALKSISYSERLAQKQRLKAAKEETRTLAVQRRLEAGERHKEVWAAEQAVRREGLVVLQRLKMETTRVGTDGAGNTAAAGYGSRLSTASNRTLQFSVATKNAPEHTVLDSFPLWVRDGELGPQIEDLQGTLRDLFTCSKLKEYQDPTSILIARRALLQIVCQIMDIISHRNITKLITRKEAKKIRNVLYHGNVIPSLSFDGLEGSALEAAKPDALKFNERICNMAFQLNDLLTLDEEISPAEALKRVTEPLFTDIRHAEIKDFSELAFIESERAAARKTEEARIKTRRLEEKGFKVQLESYQGAKGSYAKYPRLMGRAMDFTDALVGEIAARGRDISSEDYRSNKGEYDREIVIGNGKRHTERMPSAAAKAGGRIL